MNQCQDCGELKESVIERPCPYAQEIYDKTVLVTICDECSHERAMDI